MNPAAATREQLLLARKQGLRTQSELREANERLVVATVRAQGMAGAAATAAALLSHMASHDSLTGLPYRRC